MNHSIACFPPAVSARLALLTLAVSAFVPAIVSAQVLSSSVAAAGLESYASCQFHDGLQVVAVDPLSTGVNARSVDTQSGKRVVAMSAGYRVMFAYPDTDFFANAKAEKLPAGTYGEEKQILIENYGYMLASSPDNHENKALPVAMHDLEIHGFDRSKLESGYSASTCSSMIARTSC